MSKSFFVLTTHGEVGPVDRDTMRSLLREGSIQRSDQVRNAFGRMQGTVADQLGRTSGPQHAATASDRRQLPQLAHGSGRRPTVTTGLNPRMVMISALAGLALIGGTVAFMAMGRNALPRPAPSPPVTAPPAASQSTPAARPTVPRPEPAPVPAPDASAAPPVVQPIAVPQPTPTPAAANSDLATVCISVDDRWTAYLNGVKIGSGGNWRTASVAKDLLLRQGTNVLAVVAKNDRMHAGLLFDIQIGSRRITSGPDGRWQELKPPEDWLSAAFDDSTWARTVVIGPWGRSPWGKNAAGIPRDTKAEWVWSHGGRQKENQTIHLRFTFQHPALDSAPTSP